jgi:hypothetical protein
VQNLLICESAIVFLGLLRFSEARRRFGLLFSAKELDGAANLRADFVRLVALICAGRCPRSENNNELYSPRNASIGSTLAARLAGSAAASRATTPSTAVVLPRTNRSHSLTP